MLVHNPALESWLVLLWEERQLGRLLALLLSVLPLWPLLYPFSSFSQYYYVVVFVLDVFITEKELQS
jgi:hypothetical protein